MIPRTWWSTWPHFNSEDWLHLYEQVRTHPYPHQLVLTVLQSYLPLTLPKHPAYQIHQVFYLGQEFMFYVQHKTTLVCWTFYTFWSDVCLQKSDVWYHLPVLAAPWESDTSCLAHLLPLALRHLQLEELTHWLFFHQQHATSGFIEYWLSQPPMITTTEPMTVAIQSTRRVRRKVTHFE